MDQQVTWVIFTVALNALVTGIVVYLIQKKIESSYTKRLEEFRANLQYSNFEQQTKFARLHEKRVETLETLYQKYVVITHDFYNIISESGSFERKHPIGYETVGKISLRLDDFWRYLVNNRLFIPSGASEEIHGIYLWSLRVVNNLDPLLDAPGEVFRSSLEQTNYNIEIFNLGIDPLDLENPNLAAFADAVRSAVRSRLEALEMLYKLAAESKT